MSQEKPKHAKQSSHPSQVEARKAAFLEAVRKTGNIGEACTAIGIARSTQKTWREEDDYEDAFQEAMADAADNLEKVARRRAVGYEEPIIHKDQVVWARNPDGTLKLDDDFEPIPLTRTVQSDQVLIKMLEAKKPEYRTKSLDVNGKLEGGVHRKVTVEFVRSNGEGGKVDDEETDPLES